MAVGYKRFTRAALSGDERRELEVVDALASRLCAHLEQCTVDIDAVHVHGAQSGDVQRIVARLLREEIGFEEERRLAQTAGLTTRARPDFVFHLSDGRGILAEVERGGTTTNNHDLKVSGRRTSLRMPNTSSWSSRSANWSADGRSRERPFDRVAQRLGAFFGDERREVDVTSAHIFGYGRAQLAGGLQKLSPQTAVER